MHVVAMYQEDLPLLGFFRIEGRLEHRIAVHLADSQFIQHAFNLGWPREFTAVSPGSHGRELILFAIGDARVIQRRQ